MIDLKIMLGEVINFFGMIITRDTRLRYSIQGREELMPKKVLLDVMKVATNDFTTLYGEEITVNSPLVKNKRLDWNYIAITLESVGDIKSVEGVKVIDDRIARVKDKLYVDMVDRIKIGDYDSESGCYMGKHKKKDVQYIFDAIIKEQFKDGIKGGMKFSINGVRNDSLPHFTYINAFVYTSDDMTNKDMIIKINKDGYDSEYKYKYTYSFDLRYDGHTPQTLLSSYMSRIQKLFYKNGQVFCGEFKSDDVKEYWGIVKGTMSDDLCKILANVKDMVALDTALKTYSDELEEEVSDEIDRILKDDVFGKFDSRWDNREGTEEDKYVRNWIAMNRATYKEASKEFHPDFNKYPKSKELFQSLQKLKGELFGK